jgi:NADH-quinone oxidoreductase subunit L
MVLAGLSMLGGLLNLPFGRMNFLAKWLHVSVVNAHAAEVGEGLNVSVALISTGLALFAIALSWLLYGRTPLTEGEHDPLESAGPVFTFLNRKWYWDELYHVIFVAPYNRLADFLANTLDWAFWHDYVHENIIADAFKGWASILSQPVDMGVVDGAVNGIAELIGGSSQGLRKVQTGYVRNYALAVALGVVVILGFLAFQLLR